MLMQYSFSKTVFLAATVLCGMEILPDRVKLKNGKIYENVKTSLRENTLVIQYESGKREIVQASEIAELKPAKTQWKQTDAQKTEDPKPPAKEEKKEEAASAKPEKPSESNYTYLYSLIPGWSSLNTGRYWYAGIGISLLELGALRRISGKNEIRPLLSDQDAGNLHILSLMNMRETGIGNPVRDAILIGFYRRHTLDGRDAADSLESFTNRRNGLITLSAITLLDLILSRTLQQSLPQKTENTSFHFTFRSSGKENFSLAFTKFF